MSEFLGEGRIQANDMKLLVQPEHGIAPLLDAIRKAKKCVRILIFRFDRPEIEKALTDAVQRGVSVSAMIAYTNQGDARSLRRLEMRLLERGVTVTRTADDLVRYHGKMMIIDDRDLYVLGYNFTHLDIDLSRSFGVKTSSPAVVKEAVCLFEADAKRQPYENRKSDLVVSPVNARQSLTEFIRGARKQLLLYEMKISDRDFLKLLNKKISEGVEVRILSRASAKNAAVPVRRLPTRLHLRSIIRDGKEAFVGSQSLRKLELEARREIGLIFREKQIVKEMVRVFESDWKQSEPVIQQDAVTTVLTVPAKKVAREVAKHVSVKPVVEQVLNKALEGREDVSIEPADVAETVREAIRDEVQDAVMTALRELVIQGVQPDPETATEGK
jgi:cardiolipin synthase